MKADRNAKVARAALILALTLVLQSLRVLMPIPPLFSTFIIGTMVNACLLVALEGAGLGAAVFIAAVAPVVAFLQQLLPLPVFIVPVAVGNLLYVLVYRSGLRWGRGAAVGMAAVAKSAFLYAAFVWLLSFIDIPPKLAAALTFAMSWPQLLTAVAGGVVAAMVVKRIGKR